MNGFVAAIDYLREQLPETPDHSNLKEEWEREESNLHDRINEIAMTGKDRDDLFMLIRDLRYLFLKSTE